MGTNRYLHTEKKILDLNLMSHTEVNFKWIKDLHIRAKTIKLLEENMRHPLF